MKLDSFLSKCVKKENNRKQIKQFLEKISDDEEIQKYIMYEVCQTDDIQNSLKNKQFLFSHDAFDSIRILLKEQEDFLDNPIQVEDGIIECHKCHGKKTFSYSKQTRASDEATTVFVQCTECKHQFRL